jgi:hypothetical protein
MGLTKIWAGNFVLSVTQKNEAIWGERNFVRLEHQANRFIAAIRTSDSGAHDRKKSSARTSSAHDKRVRKVAQICVSHVFPPETRFLNPLFNIWTQ